MDSSYIGGFRCKFWGAFEEQIHGNWWHHHFMTSSHFFASQLLLIKYIQKPLYNYYGPLVKKSTFRFSKHALFIELSPRTSWRTFEGRCLDILLDKTANTQSFKNLNVIFWPMFHRCKKCGDISELTSGGRAEIENVKNDRPSDLQLYLHQQILLLKCHCTFYIYETLDEKAFLSDFEKMVY